jgi:alkylation response protein AidB-like acyl-CoA dehydrogenase
VGAFALSEPGAGSNPAEMETAARREGDEYVVDGEKQWMTNGQRAGVVVLFAKTDREAPDSITQFLVETDRDGLTVGEPRRNSASGPATRRRSRSTRCTFRPRTG